MFLLAFDVYALTAPYFSRRSAQHIASMATCIALDLLLLRFKKGVRLIPLSGFITSLGILLLCDSPYVWPYAVIAAISILSKHFITIDGRHVFNPNNFGMVVGLLFMSQWMVTDPGRWGNSIAGMALIACLGAWVVSGARRLPASASYVGAFVIGGFIRSWITGQPVWRPLIPMTGAAFNLFTFYMITDPATCPPETKKQASFGALCGALDATFRHFENLYSPFFALFITCGAWRTLDWAGESAADYVRRRFPARAGNAGFSTARARS
ncbi:MAG: RnfABCDGE type electron transport complex subunit D [Elusimicrobia bacterium]|nr:RnfABCDGE type electron transport complex subunit D [Elusimicrobiota bacterium]